MSRGPRLQPPRSSEDSTPVVQRCFQIAITGSPPLVTITGQRLHASGYEHRELIRRGATPQETARLIGKIIMERHAP